jgi:DNA-binding IclR family transcriptional regulator
MSRAPSATRTLRVLRFLAGQPQPVAAEYIAQAVGLPRASAYRLLTAMVDEGFVVHLREEGTFGLGVAAFEAGSGYLRQAPLQRLARLPLARLVDRVGESAHLAVLHGRDVLYVVEERAPGRPPLVTDVGVRLPAHLTASGRAMLAMLPGAQVRALFPNRAAFASRGEPADGAVNSPSALRAVLTDTRRRGHAFEDGEVTAGFASVAGAVVDHNGHPTAAVALTFDSGSAGTGVRVRLAATVREVAADLGRRLRGRAAPA